MAQKSELFKKYSKNWKLVRPLFAYIDQGLKDQGDFQVAVVCPLCNYILEEQALSESGHPQELTVEHVPPVSVGGRGCILLCRTCNSKAGTTIDKAILEYHDILPFKRKEIGSSVQVKGKLESKGKQFGVQLHLERDGEKSWFMKFHLNQKGDEYRRNVLMNAVADYKLHVTGKYPSNKQVQIALLKIAYLIAFEKFGHCFILAGDYRNIRKQIANPNESILPNCGFINTKPDFPFAPGIYLIPKPSNVRGFMVVFEIKYKKLIEKYAILLPPPNTNDLAYYRGINVLVGKPFDISNWRVFKDVDYLHDENFIVSPILEFMDIKKR
jgi:hypothetical protein